MSRSWKKSLLAEYVDPVIRGVNCWNATKRPIWSIDLFVAASVVRPSNVMNTYPVTSSPTRDWSHTLAINAPKLSIARITSPSTLCPITLRWPLLHETRQSHPAPSLHTLILRIPTIATFEFIEDSYHSLSFK